MWILLHQLQQPLASTSSEQSCSRLLSSFTSYLVAVLRSGSRAGTALEERSGEGELVANTAVFKHHQSSVSLRCQDWSYLPKQGCCTAWPSPTCSRAQWP